MYFTEEKIRRKIRKLRAASAAGPDKIGPNLLQELEKELSRGLMLIYIGSPSTQARYPKIGKMPTSPQFSKRGQSGILATIVLSH